MNEKHVELKHWSPLLTCKPIKSRPKLVKLEPGEAFGWVGWWVEKPSLTMSNFVFGLYSPFLTSELNFIQIVPTLAQLASGVENLLQLQALLFIPDFHANFAKLAIWVLSARVVGKSGGWGGG